MLQKLRDKVTGVVAWVIIGLLALVFAAWGAYGIVDVSFGPGQYAAKVNGDKISLEAANQAWLQQQSQIQRFLGDAPLAPEEREQLKASVLERLVNRAMLVGHARDVGYRTTDEQVRQAIAAEPAFQIDGQYSAQLAKAALAQVGLTPAAFEADLRRSQPVVQMQSAIQISDFLTPKELARIVALEDEQREIRYALYTAADYGAGLDVSAADIQARYEADAAQYMTTEAVRLAYGELRLEQAAAQVQVAEEDLHALYEQNRDRYAEAEKRRASHILIQSSGSDDAAALAEARSVLEQLRAGGDFAALAREHSDDPGSAQAGGDLGWAERDFYVEPFADALFSMEEGAISEPVKTQFGYHIIRLDGIQAGHAQSFEEARPELEAEFRRNRAMDIFGDRQEALQTRVESGVTDFDALAQEFNLATGTVDRFERGAGGGVLGNDADLQDLVFSPALLNEGLVGGPIALGEDRIVVVKVLDHSKPEQKPLAEVRDQVVASIRRDRGLEAARAAAQADLEQSEGGQSFESAVDKSLQGPTFVGRTDPAVPEAIRTAAFAMPRPEPGGQPVHELVTLPDGAALVELVSVRADVTQLSAEVREQRSRQIATRMGMGDVAAYVQHVRNDAKIETNPDALQ